MRLRKGEKAGALIVEVNESSPLYGVVEPGDSLLTVNRRRPRDLIDLLWLQQEEELLLSVRKRGEELAEIRLCKDAGEPLGLVFRDVVFDGIRSCSCACSFCFVDQLPPGLRKSLYIKDDDYRLSVLQGNFITLNGLGERDFRRILRLNLQPLYISLHTTDARLRDRMMGTRNSKRALSRLSTLISGGLEVHLQVVLCPGINDGVVLEETLEECLESYPARSLAVVPVSVIKELGGREAPRPLKPLEAQAALETVGRFQEKALRRLGRRFCFAADELFCLSGAPFPESAYYEDFPQLENGVGLARSFIDGAREALRREGPLSQLEDVVLLTGKLGERVLSEALGEPSGDLPVRILALENRVFGPGVTVSALLGGREMKDALRNCNGCRLALLPRSALCENRFIDGISMDDLSSLGKTEVKPVEPEGEALVEELHRWERGRRLR